MNDEMKQLACKLLRDWSAVAAANGYPEADYGPGARRITANDLATQIEEDTALATFVCNSWETQAKNTNRSLEELLQDEIKKRAMPPRP